LEELLENMKYVLSYMAWIRQSNVGHGFVGINTKEYLTIKQWKKKTHLHIQTVNLHVHYIHLLQEYTTFVPVF